MKQPMKPKPEQLPANPDTVWRMLGLAIRAGRATTGTEAAEQALRRHKACLVMVAADTAENTRRQITNQCQQAGVPCRQFGSKAEMGHWTGHETRAVVAILDQGFARQLQQLIDRIENQADMDRQATE